MKEVIRKVHQINNVFIEDISIEINKYIELIESSTYQVIDIDIIKYDDKSNRVLILIKLN